MILARGDAYSTMTRFTGHLLTSWRRKELKLKPPADGTIIGGERWTWQSPPNFPGAWHSFMVWVGKIIITEGPQRGRPPNIWTSSKSLGTKGGRTVFSSWGWLQGFFSVVSVDDAHSSGNNRKERERQLLSGWGRKQKELFDGCGAGGGSCGSQDKWRAVTRDNC